jgi:Zn-dependent protease/predicted transcriptional regulator
MNATKTRGRGLELLSVGGIKIAVDASWLIIFLLVLWSLSAGYFPMRYPGYPAVGYWGIGLVATLLFFVSVLTHELSHAMVARRLGHDVRRITLFIFGGMAQLTGEPRSPRAELAIAAVGPLTSLVLGGLFTALASGLEGTGTERLVVAMFGYLGFINIALAVFNLLPGFPLDGGRLLRAFFWHRSGDFKRATARAADWGGGIAIGIMALGGLEIFAGALVGGLWLIFIGMFLRGAAKAGYYGVALQQTLADTRVEDVMAQQVVTISPDSTLSEAVEDYFLRYGFAGFPVASNGTIEGMLPLSRVQKCPADERPQRKVRDVMQPFDDSLVAAPEESAASALEKMTAADSGRLVVLDHGRLEGIITRSAITRFMQVRSALEPSSR